MHVAPHKAIATVYATIKSQVTLCTIAKHCIHKAKATLPTCCSYNNTCVAIHVEMNNSMICICGVDNYINAYSIATYTYVAICYYN